MEDGISKLNRLYEKHKASFVGAFHNVLWLVLVNGEFEERDAALVVATPMTHDDKPAWEIGVADRGAPGYTPTGAVFVGNYDEASAVLDELNEELFGLDERAATVLVLSTMKRSA